jgi:hypothetical protein
MPPYFGRRFFTRTLTLLCVNRYLTMTELRALSGSSDGDQHVILRKLLSLGVIQRIRYRTTKPVCLNRSHPSYKGFLAFGKAAQTHWHVPKVTPRPAPASLFPKGAKPTKPVCTLFHYETGTRCLLFIAAAGKANTVELADMLGLHSARDALNAVRALERRMLVRRIRVSGVERPAIINPEFFAKNELMMILRGLLKLHPEIKTLVAKMRKFRTNRLRKENWYKPHIKGPRRGL